jgi:hypothetical protein
LPLLVLLAFAPAGAQEVSLEYRVKATYLYNFVKFVQWPEPGRSGALTLCVAGRNPFGTALDDIVRDEVVGGRTLATRVILEPEPGCDVLFIPQGAAVATYLRAANGLPTLTVGEGLGFLEQGGIIAFVNEGPYVRFAIDAQAARRSKLEISSRLLQLAINTRSGR